jgi:AcrR family transcriptional regulator
MSVHKELPMSVEKLQTRVRQEQIAQAALDLVATDGVKKLSVAAVAGRVGLVPSALYRHFKGKAQVLDATLELIHSKLLENVKAVGQETDDVLAQLHGLLMRHVRLIQENRGIPRIIFSQDFYAGHPDRRGRVYQIIRGYLAQVARIIRNGQKAGQIDRQIDPGVASVMFLGLIQPSAVLSHMSEGEFDVMRQAQRAWPLFVKAMEVCPRQGVGRQHKGKQVI